MSQQKLYVGLDLRDDITQLAVMGPSQLEPDILTVGDGDEETINIRTEVAIPGTEELVRGFLGSIYRQEVVQAGGRESNPVNVLAAFLRKTLSLTRKKYPSDTIRKLVVTSEYGDYHVISAIYSALARLGLGKDRALVVDRQQSFVYYVMSQKRELWVNQVGMFDYGKDRLTYYQMQSDRAKRTTLVRVVERDYSDYAELFGSEEQSPGDKASIFEGMVQGAIHGQIITTLYMTGAGFADGFADGVMKNLCVGRHLFKGDNLYVSGACYMARECGGERKLEDFVYLGRDAVASHISMQVYTDAKVQELLLVKAGTAWYHIDYEVELIPDGDRELELCVKNAVTKERTTHLIPMDGIVGRTERRARVGIQIRFAGPNQCIFTLRDKGFGDFFPSSYRIWEKTITL